MDKTNNLIKYNNINNKFNKLLLSIFLIIVTSISFIIFFVFKSSISNLIIMNNIKIAYSMVAFLTIILMMMIFLISYIAFVNSRNKMLYIELKIFYIVSIIQIYLYSYLISNGLFFAYQNKFANLLLLVTNIVLVIGLVLCLRIDPSVQVKKFKKNWLIFGTFYSIAIILLTYLINKAMVNVFSIFIYDYIEMGIYFLITLVYFLGILKIYKIYKYKSGFFLSFILMGVLLLFFSNLSFVVFKNKEYFVLCLSLFYRFLGLLLLFIAILINNVNKGNLDIRRQEEQLSLYAKNLEKIIIKRTDKINNVNRQFIKELEYARSIQQSLLPERRIHFKNGVNFTSEYFPCERLSGDYFDIYKIDENNVAMYILDVSGHGISAALMTMFCNNFVKSTERLIKRYRGLKPHRNLKHFYDEFNKMNFPDEMHMVIFFATYNVVDRVLTYCSGGMNCLPILVKKDGEIQYLDQSSGFPICKMMDFFEPEYISVKITLEKGDKLLFYTDGLTDEEKNNVFNHKELIELLRINSKLNGKEINDLIINNIFPHIERLEDDISYFIMDI